MQKRENDSDCRILRNARQDVENFKKATTTSAHLVAYALTQEEYKQKKKLHRSQTNLTILTRLFDVVARSSLVTGMRLYEFQFPMNFCRALLAHFLFNLHE